MPILFQAHLSVDRGTSLNSRSSLYLRRCPPSQLQDLLIGAEETKQPGIANIDIGVAQACNAARSQIKTIIGDNGAETGDIIQQHIEKNSSALLCVDRDFGVELAVFDLLAGSSSETRLVMHIMSCMPSETKAVEPENALQALTNLSRKEVTKLANRPAQAKLQVCIKVIGRIVDGRELDVADIRLCPILKAFYARLPLFIRHGTSATAATGEAALAAILAEAQTKHEQGTATREDVQPLRTYSHWLAPASKDLARELVASSDEKTGASLAKAARKGAANKKSATASSSEKKSDSAVLAAAAFFS